MVGMMEKLLLGEDSREHQGELCLWQGPVSGKEGHSVLGGGVGVGTGDMPGRKWVFCCKGEKGKPPRSLQKGQRVWSGFLL